MAKQLGKGSVTVVEDAASPPPGWTARAWAIAEAARGATADWLLITRGDIDWDERAIAGLTAFARERQADLVSLFGRQETTTTAERIVLPVLFQALATVSPLAAVNDPARQNVAVAFEECLLIKRSAWSAVGGLKPVAERDSPWNELARLVKASGRRIVVGSGRPLFLVRHGLTNQALRARWAKALGTVVGNHPGFLQLAALVVLAVNVLPFGWLLLGLLGLFLNPGSIPWTMCGVIGLAQCGVALGIRRWLDRFTTAPAHFLITHPVGGLMVIAILLQAAHRPKGAE
ncbi:MAG: hypothetical protein U0556_13545 [Dehalococcoidia bacterium]